MFQFNNYIFFANGFAVILSAVALPAVRVNRISLEIQPRIDRKLFPVLARATRALFSVQSLATVVFSGVCSVISLGCEVLYLINSCVGILSSLDASASLEDSCGVPFWGRGGTDRVPHWSPPSPPISLLSGSSPFASSPADSHVP